jgi:hypothetical protein
MKNERTVYTNHDKSSWEEVVVYLSNSGQSYGVRVLDYWTAHTGAKFMSYGHIHYYPTKDKAEKAADRLMNTIQTRVYKGMFKHDIPANWTTVKEPS